jgi:hypothetical protein
VQRLTTLDPRALMAIVGGVLGVVLVIAVLALRGAYAAPGIGYPYGVIPSYAPPPFEPLGSDGLYEAFDRLGRVTVAGRPARLSVARAEDIVLPSGRITVGDAYLLDASPLPVTFPSGRHAVLVLEVTNDYGPAVAAALIRVADSMPVQWKPLTTYGVDSGTTGFASPEALAAFHAMSSRKAQAITGQLLDEYDAGAGYILTAAVTIDPSSSANLVTVTSGYGDGSYRVWFGEDAGGKAVALLASFDLIDDPTKPNPRADGLAGASPQPSESE